MMEEMYGFHPPVDYAVPAAAASMSPPVNLVSPSDYSNFLCPGAFRDRIPIFGSDHHFFSTVSAISEAPSSIAPEIRRRGAEEHISSHEIKAKIASHPRYPRLLEAYIDCQKVGAPPEVECLLEEIRRYYDVFTRNSVSTCLGSDPELDEFMETYCDMLVKYKSDLARPFDEATTFLSNVEKQLSNLCNDSSRSCVAGEAAGSSEEEDLSGGEIEAQEAQPTTEDRELKDKLLRKYSGYISSLKQEFSKRKKKGKLPKEARQTLLDWWNSHYKWPYPTEADKIALAESTDLDQKQINNWFINQRKRHWKPSESMQFAVVNDFSGPFFMDN